MGCVVPILVRLAAMSADGSARHRPPLAPPSFRLALDQEIAPVVRQMVVPYIKGILSYLAQLFGLGLQADSPTGEKYSQRTWTVPWPDFKKMRFV